MSKFKNKTFWTKTAIERFIGKINDFLSQKFNDKLIYDSIIFNILSNGKGNCILSSEEKLIDIYDIQNQICSSITIKWITKIIYYWLLSEYKLNMPLNVKDINCLLTIYGNITKEQLMKKKVAVILFITLCKVLNKNAKKIGITIFQEYLKR